MDNIIELEGYKFERKSGFIYSRLHKNRCRHYNMTLDDQGYVVRCSDCGEQLSSYWVLNEILSCYRKRMLELERDNEKAKNLKKDMEKEHKFIKVLRSIQSAWRGKSKMAVCCPWCDVGIMPEDGLGNHTTHPDYDFKRKKLIKERNNG